MMGDVTDRWAIDAKPDGTALHTFVQWKGTDLCMDIYCECGRHSHIDGMFAYTVQCPACGQVYELSTRLLARKVDQDSDRPRVVGDTDDLPPLLAD